MSSYLYSLLPGNGDNIRLLRLLPNENEAAPLHCELCNYSLQRLSIRTHLYKALSYVWGDPKKTLSIYVDKNQFQITLIAKIYSSAHRVIVWLGEQIIEIKGALEDIQLAANNEELIEHSKKEIKQQEILNLLQNPWFQRIWVLQEVAAARDIVIMCGSTTIDGYIFCLGVKSLKFSYITSTELQTLSSVIYLIERAGLRLKFRTDLSERFSLNIRSLAELIDMFHTRQATDSRDKVYALLGMSSDYPEKAGLQPDYDTSWEELFQQLVKFVLGKDISVEISGQRAVIQCKGCILGQVFSVRKNDEQNLIITSRNTACDLGGTIEWTLQASAKPIQENDIICLLYGASKPTIIRLCKDHFDVVIIAATTLNQRSRFKWPKISQSTTRFLRDFLLVWDWGNSYEKLQDQEEYDTLAKTYSQSLFYLREKSGEYLNEAMRLWNDIAILDDLKEHEKADERLLKARSDYMAAFGKDYMPGPLRQYGRTLLSFVAGEGHKDITKLLLNISHPDIKNGKNNLMLLLWAAKNGHEGVVRLLLTTSQVEVDLKDSGYNRTPLSWAARNGHEAVVKILLATSQIEADWKDKCNHTPLSLAAENGHEAVVKLLLATDQVEADLKDKYNRTPLLLAARNGHTVVVKILFATGQVKVDWKSEYNRTLLLLAVENRYEAVIKILLATGQVEINLKSEYNRTLLSLATRNGHEAVVKLLLATDQIKVNWKSEYNRTPLSLAAENGHKAVVKLLLTIDQIEINLKSEYNRTPLSLAAENGHKAVIKLLFATGQVEVNLKDKYNQTLLSLAARNEHAVVVKLLLATDQVEAQAVLSRAATNGREAIVKILLATGQVEADWKDEYNRTPLLLAAENGHEAVVKLLLATGQVEADWKDEYNRTPLLWAARNGHKAIVKLLLATGQIKVDWKDKYNRTPLSLAARNGHEAVVKLLLATGQVEAQEALLLAARNGHEVVVKLLHNYIN
ncbi:hypothetical protein BPAE_0704g00010 [Botrytis paeoniae]|uniref:Heterokaryon incompatibility domain-containing protein n=1 Tax=Botrytis paeoniae TaxID=278948 RepID=A0A4Z1EYC9_9HELO|nr:hypothetical protein BPAE_0704g00010 [Botrytis paeoniae]